MAVKSLFDITLDFIAINIDSVESLKEFPDIIGEKLYQRCIELEVFKDKHRSTDVFRLFADAYPDKFMVSMRIHSGLVFINEYLDQVTVLMRYLRSLDLSFSLLGSHHEMIQLIGSLEGLENLALRKNYLSNDAIRNISLPMHLFGNGPTKLKFLDLSNNRELNDQMIGWLSRFKQLQYLNLTETCITEYAHKILKEKCSLHPCDISELEQMCITTQGWAGIMLEEWVNAVDKRIKERQYKRTPLVKKRWAQGSGPPELKDSRDSRTFYWVSTRSRKSRKGQEMRKGSQKSRKGHEIKIIV